MKSSPCPSCGCKRWRRVGSIRSSEEEVMRVVECMKCDTVWAIYPNDHEQNQTQLPDRGQGH